MKLTKKLETEVLKVYHTYWDSYLSGDIKTFASLLDDNCHIIGSTAHDTFNNKKNAVAFYKATAKEIAGVGQYRNRNITVLPEGNNVMVQEICDYYFLNKKEWHFYGVARLSTLFSKRSGKWKIIHQHGSLPDSRAEEGQQLGTEKITKENLRLKEAIKRNTIELQNKNRELEIETSLEKVRAVAMGMHKPEHLLNICEVLFKELTKIGFDNMRCALIHIFRDEKKYFDDYNYSDFTGGKISTLPYKGNVTVEAFLKKIRKSKDSFAELVVKGKELEAFKNFRKKSGQVHDKRLLKAKEINYYFFSVGLGNIGISNFGKISKEQLLILKRFRNVFNLAYQRYSDIAKAEAQAREAQVEASLERVRAQAMAMHHQEDLQNICETLYKEFNSLGFDGLRNAMINIHNDEQKTFVNYDYSDVIGKSINHLTYNIHPEIEKQIKQVRKANDAFSETVFKGKGLESMKKFRKKIGEKDDPRIKNCKALYYYFYSIGTGAIGISTFNPVTEEKLELLKRFRNVFALSYQRYTDIALAEAQAREAEIELALERVRARTMAMQKSEELSETTHLLFEQLKNLGQTAAQLSIGIIKEEKGIFELSATVHGTSLLQTYDVPLNEPFVIKKAVKAWKQKKKTFTIELKGNELTAYNKWRNSVLKKKIVFPEKQWIVNIVFFSKGLLSFSSDKEISKETFQLLERFANVFDGTYTRFLDLQKAETQAKEARIETALERVRAVAMAMKKSDEVINVCEVMYKELQSLGFTNIRNAQIALKNDSRQSYSISVYSDNESVIFGEAHYHSSPIVKDLYRELEKSKDAFYQREFSGKKFNDWRKWREGLSPFADSREASAASMCFYLYSIGIGHIGISTFNAITEIQIQMLKRFKNVFELCYTRYIDVAKAEVQAREAQIEASLERVRSRSLAMHNTSELQEVIHTVHKELLNLDIAINGGSFIAINSEIETTLRCWGSGGTADTTEEINIPLYKKPFCTNLINNIKKGTGFFTEAFTQKEKKDFFTFLFKHQPWSKLSAKQKKETLSSPGGYTRSCFVSKHTSIFIINHFGETFSTTDNDILQRFGKVFEQSYTRFLDLQKAETQAREAQIELALERIRARTMAMQHSDDLQDTAILLFQQVQSLGIKTGSCGFNIWIKDEKAAMVWTSSQEGRLQIPFKLPHTQIPFYNRVYEAAEKGEEFLVEEIGGKALKEQFNYLRKLDGIKDVIKKYDDAGIVLPSSIIYHEVFFKQGYLSFHTHEPAVEAHDIFNRFGKVFEQTYTRFLDLQKAEAQAREAQIELGLERVRARAMAMQNSEELKELIGRVFVELTKLDLVLTRCLIMIYDPKTNDSTWWMANSEAPTEPIGLKVQYHGHTPYLAYIKAWQKKQLKWTYSLEGEIKNQWDNFLFTETELSHLPDFVIAGMKAPDKVYLNASFNSFGNLTLATLDPLSDEHFDIMLRFAKVFDLTYTRFNDLKQAEAQAREAKIEAALERVRSRTMGMQKSDELKEVIQVVYDQFVHLNINTEHAGFVMDYKLRDDRLIWVASKYGLPSRLTIPYFDSVYYNSFNEAKEKGLDFFATNLDFEEKNNFYRLLFAYIPGLPEEDREFYFNCPGLAISTVLLENIGLYIENFEGTPYSDEDNAILMRFGKVFQQTYTRFLDLQKAEAQAREAKIETALEKVRSRTMAMQRSEELPEAANNLFLQVQALGIPAWSAGYCIWNDDKAAATAFMSSEGVIQKPFVWPSVGAGYNFYEPFQKGESFAVQELGGEEIVKHYEFMRTLPVFGDVIDGIMEAGFPLPTFQIFHFVYFPQGFLMFITYEPVLQSHDIFKRFAKVFEQTYTRFLDLQKAETQSRENKIQLALERARTQSMIMQHSNELDDTLRVFHEQVLLLGINSAFSFLWLPDEDKSNHIFWAAWQEHKNDSTTFKSKAITYPLDRSEPATAQCLVDWRSGEPVHSYAVKPAEVDNYFTAWAELLDGVEKLKPEFFRKGLYYVEAFMKYGCFGVMLENDLSDEEKNILYRFSVEFERTYTRFLDLQKAEAQAREAEIELALERVRARTMAMQHSDELLDAATLLFQQIELLGAPTWNCSFNIWDEDKKHATAWNGTKEGFGRPFKSNSSENVFLDFYKGGHKGEKLFVKEMGGTALENHYKYLSSVPGVSETLVELKAAGVALPTFQIFHIAYFAQGYLMFITYEPVPQFQDIFKRFAKVFEQTYTRFLDLQKAEAQAREAEIELALERVRARTMAMQHSDELADASFLLDQQVRALGIKTWGCAFNIYGEKESTEWFSNEMGTMQTYKTPREKVFLDYYQAGQKGETLLIKEFSGKECIDWYNYLCTLPGIGDGLKQMIAAGGSFPTRQIDHVSFFKYGYLLFISFEPAPEAHDIFIRFAKVFEQTYTRFLDLQKAESQVREASIEAAVEKVRSRSLSMHKSEEIGEVVWMVVEKMKDLNVELSGISLVTYIPDTKDTLHWHVNPEVANNSSSMLLPYFDELICNDCLEAKEKGIELLSKIYTKEQKDSYFNKAVEVSDFKYFPEELKQWVLDQPCLSFSFAIQKHSGIFLEDYAGKIFSKEDNDILIRFSRVFEQSYVRFLDLQKAEAQARESQIEAALERVRSRTLAMQKSDELADTSIVIFEQLINLGIEPNRLFIGIINNETAAIEAWATNEDGTKIGNHFTLNTNRNESVKKMYEGWKKKKKSLTIDMTGTELQNYFHYLADEMQIPFKGGLSQKRRVQTIAYFGQGLIGMASPDEQPEATTLLLERFAAVFNLTYTRFNDLKVAEAHAIQAEEDLIKLQTEKKRAEDALTELQSTQKQLIQSEKMASLGELTAGIAHEIQNPLNFVNNFSEVSKELLDEMKTEMENGNMEDAKEIMNDVIQNLEKINHHGKRADGIVKGMLQHSRSSSAVKEPTDINALCDEYLRLSYHGLRAKDKSFNATMKTDFDKSIGNINIIPQDIGRVVLNLLTNAFYAVDEKKKIGIAGYEPTVTIITRYIQPPLGGQAVEIKVSDNGGGIPQKVLDKIFQPFFTTKPTGQGTGLGLSLSYDIIKAHAGEIRVNTKEGEGSEFIIKLLTNQKK